LASEIEGLTDRDVAITLLVVRWVEANHKEKVYSLILKKAMSWLKKQEMYEEYLKTYSKYVQ
jgi:hypothetical protein